MLHSYDDPIRQELDLSEHNPSVVVEVGAFNVDAAFLDKMGIAGVASDTVSGSKGLVERRDNGDGTFLQIHKPGYEPVDFSKDQAYLKGYPIRIEITEKGTVRFVFRHSLNGHNDVELGVADPSIAMGTRDNPFILDSAYATDQIVALSRLIEPYIRDGHNVGIYAVLPKDPAWQKEDGSSASDVYFINDKIPTLDVPEENKKDFPNLSGSVDINSPGRTVEINLLSGVLISSVEPEIKKYGEQVVKPYAQYFNTGIQIIYGHDQVIEYSHYQQMKPTAGDVLRSFIVGQTMTQPVAEKPPEGSPTRFSLRNLRKSIARILFAG